MAVEALTLTRSRLEIDSQGLRGRLEGASFDISWYDVLALRLIAHEKQRQYLSLGLADRGIVLSLNTLDVDAVMRAVMEVVPENALESDAFSRLAWVRDQQQEHAALLAGVNGPTRIRIKTSMAVIGWIGMAIFLFAFLWWNEEGVALRLLFLGFALGSAFLIYAGYATVEILPESVRLIMPIWPTFAVHWDELERAETDHNGGQIVLYGSGKRMTMPGMSYWRKADQQLGNKAFFGHLQRVHVPLRKSAVAAFKLPKGARVSRS